MSDLHLQENNIIEAAHRMGFEHGRQWAMERIADLSAEKDQLKLALKDVSKHIWRGDFNHLEESTREILNDLECNGRQDKHNA